MSAGYGALEARRYPESKAHFDRALRLRPGSAAAEDGLAQVTAAARSARVEALRESGTRAEAQERWADAVRHYAAARAIDASLVFAREGEARATRLAALTDRAQAYVDTPQRLASEAVLADAKQTLTALGAIDPAGPRLSALRAELERTVRRATTPVRVTLRSDEQTDVVVYRVGRFGRFRERELSLRPGRYVAVGSREGYRDVRREFTVAAGAEPDPVMVQCEERI
jgi:hypothetical protein